MYHILFEYLRLIINHKIYTGKYITSTSRLDVSAIFQNPYIKFQLKLLVKLPSQLFTCP